jgi:hypothetical protein
MNENLLDILIPAPWVVEQHLRRLDSHRDLLERLLAVSRERESRRQNPNPNKEGSSRAS